MDLTMLLFIQHALDRGHAVNTTVPRASPSTPKMPSCDGGYAGMDITLTQLIEGGLFKGRGIHTALSYARASNPTLIHFDTVPFAGMDVSETINDLHNTCCNMTDEQFNEYIDHQREEDAMDEDLVFTQSDFDHEQMDLEDDILTDGDSVDHFFGEEPEDFDYEEYSLHARTLSAAEMCRRHIAVDNVQMIVSGLEYALESATQCLALWSSRDAKEKKASFVVQHMPTAIFHLREASRIAVLRCITHQFDNQEKLTEQAYQEQLPRRRIVESHVNKALESIHACGKPDVKAIKSFRVKK